MLHGARTWACARRTRSGRAPGPRRRPRTCSAASTTSVDLEPELLGLGDVLVRRVDEHREVVQQRPLGLTGIALVELDERAADLDPRALRGPWRGDAEPEPLVRPRRARSGPASRARRGRGRTRPRSAPRRARDAGLRARRSTPRLRAAARPRCRRDPRARSSRSRRAAPTCLSAPRLARALRVEQRQLAAARIRADERERVGPLDHVHAEMTA